MNIVLEGPDGSGKSTLAKYLSEALNMPIYRGMGPVTDQFDYDARIKTIWHLQDHIFDRHFLISEQIYGGLRGTDYVRFTDEKQLYLRTDYFFIYCDGIMGPHVADHAKDTPSHLAFIEKNSDRIRMAYDQWACDHADLHYRQPGQKNRILRLLRGMLQPRSFDPVADVAEFHHKMGIAYVGKPRCLPFELNQFRQKFLRQEMQEYELHSDQALFEVHVPVEGADQAALTHELAQSLDALVDLAYVTLGTAHLHGFNFREAWRRVHEANMLKVPGPTSINAEDKLKQSITKPPGWAPPRHDDLVEDNAHR